MFNRFFHSRITAAAAAAIRANQGKITGIYIWMPQEIFHFNSIYLPFSKINTPRSWLWQIYSTVVRSNVIKTKEKHTKFPVACIPHVCSCSIIIQNNINTSCVCASPTLIKWNKMNGWILDFWIIVPCNRHCLTLHTLVETKLVFLIKFNGGF